MIDHENEIFNQVATRLREEYDNNIYISGSKISDTPPKFPAVSIIQLNNIVINRYITFDNIENVASESYEIECASNLTTGKEKECKKIIDIVNEVMQSNDNRYVRVFNQPIDTKDSTLARRIARYTKDNSI